MALELGIDVVVRNVGYEMIITVEAMDSKKLEFSSVFLSVRISLLSWSEQSSNETDLGSNNTKNYS